MYRESGRDRGPGAYPSTSWRRRVSYGSSFLAMLPVPPRPVVTTGFLRTGVSRSDGFSLGDCRASAMLPAPPRPCDESCDAVKVGRCWSDVCVCGCGLLPPVFPAGDAMLAVGTGLAVHGFETAVFGKGGGRGGHDAGCARTGL